MLIEYPLINTDQRRRVLRMPKAGAPFSMIVFDSQRFATTRVIRVTRGVTRLRKKTASTTYLGQESTPHFFDSETRVVLAVFFFS